MRNTDAQFIRRFSIIIGSSSMVSAVTLSGNSTKEIPAFNYDQNKMKVRLSNFGRTPYHIEKVKFNCNGEEYPYQCGVKKIGELLGSNTYSTRTFPYNYKSVLGQDDSIVLMKFYPNYSKNYAWIGQVEKKIDENVIYADLTYKSNFPTSLWRKYTTVRLRLD